VAVARGEKGAAGVISPPLNYGLSENVLVEKFSSKSTTFWAEKNHNFGDI